jgi:hypothetical protein
MNMKKLFTIVIALVTAVMLAACSGGAPQDNAAAQQPDAQKPSAEASDAQEATPEAGIIEPQQLVSKEEAAGIVGDVKDGENKEQPAVGQKICFYDKADGSGFLQISLTQQAFMDNTGNTPESLYTALKDAVADKDQETADGLGGEYFFGTPGLHILYKGYYINIAAGNSDSSGVRDVLKQAGATAVKNLDAILE